MTCKDGERKPGDGESAKPPCRPEWRLHDDPDSHGRRLVPDAVAVGSLDPEYILARIEVGERNFPLGSQLYPLVAKALHAVGITIAAGEAIVERGEFESKDFVPRQQGDCVQGRERRRKLHRLVKNIHRGKSHGWSVCIQLDRVGIEIIEAIDAAKKDAAAACSQAGARMELQALQPVRHVEIVDSAGGGVKARQAMVRAQPQTSAGVLLDSINDIAGEILIRSESLSCRIEPIQAATHGSHPEPPVTVFVDGHDCVIAQGMRVAIIVPIADEVLILWPQKVKSSEAADPEIAAAVEQQRARTGNR